MPEVRHAADFAVTVCRDGIHRMLGYLDRPVPRRVDTVLAEIEAELFPLLKPACAFLRAGPALLARSPFLRDLDDVVLCLATVGEGPEQAAAAYDHAGEMTRALLANVYGSAAAEAAAEAAEAMVHREISCDGLLCSRRFSPGYAGWEISEQPWILAVLEAETLGVSLTDGCMMVPRKSVTFAVAVGTEPREVRGPVHCDGCELLNCRHRHIADENKEHDRSCTTSTDPVSNSCPLGRWS